MKVRDDKFPYPLLERGVPHPLPRTIGSMSESLKVESGLGLGGNTAIRQLEGNGNVERRKLIPKPTSPTATATSQPSLVLALIESSRRSSMSELTREQKQAKIISILVDVYKKNYDTLEEAATNILSALEPEGEKLQKGCIKWSFNPGECPLMGGIECPHTCAVYGEPAPAEDKELLLSGRKQMIALEKADPFCDLRGQFARDALCQAQLVHCRPLIEQAKEQETLKKVKEDVATFFAHTRLLDGRQTVRVLDYIDSRWPGGVRK